MKIHGTRLSANGYEYDAITAGPEDGDLVLLLHGWPEFADCWTQEMTALAEAGYRAVAVDQRGYSPGARPTDIADYHVDHLVSDVIGFADALGAQRFHLVAHDWGGIVAWAVAGAHPDRLKTLSVLATPHPRALSKAIAEDEDQSRRVDYVRFFQRPGGVAEQSLLADDAARLRDAYAGKVPEELVEENVRRLSEPGALTATLNWYRAVGEGLGIPAEPSPVPTLYVWGSEDVALGPVAAYRTADFVDGPFRFVELTGASHWLPEEAPTEVSALILSHLAG
ncbi:alpha/beta fold hydrolase [Allokutzneria albata]|uniref:alpha/beta fold hydrolase n=1 Tax=Allokutzneria albata TaxID=211114 RepID=UPI0004C41395|nr:alpha/beta hydrolase [Allokutzneria albata]